MKHSERFVAIVNTAIQYCKWLILILVVLIGLVIIFKEQLTNLVNSIFKTITSRSGSI